MKRLGCKCSRHTYGRQAHRVARLPLGAGKKKRGREGGCSAGEVINTVGIVSGFLLFLSSRLPSNSI